MISLTIFQIITLFSFIRLFKRADCVGCKFPLEIRGGWSRSRDTITLAFSDSQLSGLGISWNSQKMNLFDCHTESAGNYIINSSFASTLGSLDFYACWKFVKITPAAFILYELSDLTNITGFDASTLGHVQPIGTSLELDKVCTQKPYFTTLVKEGSTASDVASTCPSQLNATFTYSVCPTTRLDFCQDGRTGVMDYRLCSTPIFQSASGVITCMGHVSVGQDVFINLFTSGKVICFRIPDKVDLTFSGSYYNGDCSTVISGSSMSITLNQKNLCLASTTTSTTASTTTSKQTIAASDTVVTTGQSGDNTVTRAIESKGDDSVTVGVAVGLSVGLFALVLLAVLLLVLVWRQKIKMKVSDFFQGRETKSAPIEEREQVGTHTTIADIKEENFNSSSLATSADFMQEEKENSGAKVTETDLHEEEVENRKAISQVNDKPHEDVKAVENGVGHLNGVAVIQVAKSPGKHLPGIKKKVTPSGQSKKKTLGKIKSLEMVHHKK